MGNSAPDTGSTINVSSGHTATYRRILPPFTQYPMRKYIVEFIGMFFFVLTVGLTNLPKAYEYSSIVAPIAIGSVLMVMIFAGGHISGGHFNPAVTLAVWLRGRCATRDVPGYMIAQFAGAIAAGAVAVYARNYYPDQPVKYELDLPRYLLLEFSVHLRVVLRRAQRRHEQGSSEQLLLRVGHRVHGAGGRVLGGTDHRRSVQSRDCAGITFMGLKIWSHLWVYLVANFAGGAVAALAFKGLNPQDP